MQSFELRLKLPPWLERLLEKSSLVAGRSSLDERRNTSDQRRETSDDLGTVEARMRFAIDLARKNIEHKTGGPFGAAVFETESGRLVAAGVNLVQSANCSLAHAEMVAVAFAQQALGHYDLGSDGIARELVTSTEPCAMCLGAIPWSGVRRVVCGARGQDACDIGFDEGAKPAHWAGALEARGIEVVRDVLGDDARAVLGNYLKSGGPIYNARRD